MSQYYHVTLTYRNKTVVEHSGIDWDEVLKKISATDVIDARIRLLGSDPL
jgi:hypothetical protein